MGIVDTTMAGRVEVSLVRPGPGSWGLRLQGGVDVQKALTIVNVTDGSPSEMSGLKIGDVLLQINGRDCSIMTHKAAQDAIVGSGDQLPMGRPTHSQFGQTCGKASGTARTSRTQFP